MAIKNELSLDGIAEMTPAELHHEMMCAELSQKLGQMIVKVYPGHPWAVSANIQGGIIQVWLGLDRENYGIVINLGDVATHTGPQMQTFLKRHCGELLERYGLARGAGNAEQYADMIMNCGPRGFFQKDKS